MTRIARTVICAAVLALGASAAPALADSPGYSMHLSAPATVTVGQPTVIELKGIHPPPEDWASTSWIEAGAIPASVLPSCPADDQSGIGVATGAGGDLIAIADAVNLDPVGNYDNYLGWTPRYAGKWLICGYQDDGTGFTLTRDQIIVDVANAAPAGGGSQGSGPGAAKPANVKRPSVKRSGKKLVCSPGKWSGNSGSYSYSWLVNGKARAGATGRKLAVTRKLHGRRVQCSVTASGAGGKSTATSRALRVS
jgi:hypothetical protein